MKAVWQTPIHKFISKLYLLFKIDRASLVIHGKLIYLNTSPPLFKNNGHKMLQINGMSDHVHILLGIRPIQSLSDLMKQVKQDSSKWINQQGFINGRFSWQAGYGAFSYSKSQLPKVIKYIQNQEQHHKRKTFQEEYLEFLDKFDVDYDERYIFKPIE